MALLPLLGLVVLDSQRPDTKAAIRDVVAEAQAVLGPEHWFLPVVTIRWVDILLLRGGAARERHASQSGTRRGSANEARGTRKTCSGSFARASAG